VVYRFSLIQLDQFTKWHLRLPVLHGVEIVYVI